ncbi:hypothetical protein HYR99_05040 [Candidatus Poribacteria bacterium]|nr:hypothetical protein [Candidatus Poribacteria bacterium]
MLNENQKIWRYLELWKFESMLKQNALFFSKASEMADKEEGQTSADSNLIFEHLIIKTIEQDNSSPQHHRQILGKQARISQQEKLEVNAWWQHHTFMSCWRVEDDESARAWEEYVGNKKGVVVQSTYGKLKACFQRRGYQVFTGLRKFEGYPDPNSIFIEKVEYEDVGLDFVGQPPCWAPLLYTRKGLCYEWENELRAFVMLPYKVSEKGLPIPIDLEHLVERVVVSPQTSELYDEIKSLIAKHGLGIDVRNSNLVVYSLNSYGIATRSKTASILRNDVYNMPYKLSE